MSYFTHAQTPDDIRAEYRRLAMANHPDRGGDTATMQAINLAYEAALKACSGQSFRRAQPTDDGRETWTYTYNEATERELMEAINRVLNAVAHVQDVAVTLVGTWIWITGNTRPVKDGLKSAGCWWNSRRSSWNWHPAGHGSRYSRTKDLADILAAGRRVTRDDSAAAITA